MDTGAQNSNDGIEIERMTIPYREFTSFYCNTLRGEDPTNMFGTAADWTNDHYATCMIRLSKIAGKFIRYDPLFKPDDNSFKSMTSLDHIWKVRFDILFSLQINDYVGSWAGPHGTLSPGIHPEQWNPDLVTGKNYDGANNWSNYPLSIGGSWGNITITPANFPKSYEFWLPAYAGWAIRFYPYQDGFLKNGLSLYMANFVPGIPSAGEEFLAHLTPQSIKAFYANAIVNSLSTYQAPIAGGTELIINGMGFDCDDTEIAAGGPGTVPAAGFNDMVDEIYFVPLQGQTPPAALIRGVDFVINSNLKITIATLPAMEAGTYNILLKKINVGPTAELGIIDSYAGDWICDTDGRTREDTRMVFLIGEAAVEEYGPPQPRFKWKWKSADDEVAAFFAPIDTRGTDTFWEGRLKNLSSITRSIDDRTGLFSASDVAATISNADKEMSKMLSKYWLKNQLVEFYYGWGNQPESSHEYFFRGIVDNYVLKGIHFDVTMRDLTHKYFQIRSPQYICTEADYPNIHESAIGIGIPEALGFCSLIPAVAGETSGEIEARYVATNGPPYSYLAAHSPLLSISQVYSNNVLKATPGDYTIAYRDGGRTYIDFNVNQGDNKITFNCTGYSLAGWDDPTNGYIQNPSYVISFFLTQIMGTPLDLLDMESFDTFATLCTANGWHQAGKLILQEERDSMEILKELLFSFGANLWIAKDGRLTIGRKDTTNYATDLIIFEQIHTMEHSEKQFNLNEAINWANIHWDYVPTHTLYKSAKQESTASSITDFGKELSPKTPWNLPWNISDDFVQQRIVEELLKYAYGYRKIKVTFPMDLIDVLDIFTNFRYQDPYGLSWTKEGDLGRYYYISSLAYDSQQQTIEVIGIDMQYLLSQCLIINKCATPRRIWPGSTGAGAVASPEERMFAFIGSCATGQLPDGTRNKKVCKCQS